MAEAQIDFLRLPRSRPGAGEGGDGLPLLKPRRETRKIADFVAVDDNGREYVVVEWQENRVLNGRVKWIAGLKDFRLQDSSPLNQI